MFAAPRQRSADTTSTGSAGRDQAALSHAVRLRARIQSLEVVIQSNGAENNAKKREATGPPEFTVN
jgi:hypothetical protein